MGYWAISLQQLLALKQGGCDHYSSRAEDYGQKSVADVVYDLVISLTQGIGVGWALMTNVAEPLQAAVIISHCWAESFVQFVDNIQRHDSVVGARPVWICFTGIFQCRDGDDSGPTIQDQIGVNIDRSPFTQVINHAGLSCMIVNQTGSRNAQVRDRLWCVFEMHLARLAGIPVRLIGAWLNVTGLPLNISHAKCGKYEDEKRIREAIENTDDGWSAVKDSYDRLLAEEFGSVVITELKDEIQQLKTDREGRDATIRELQDEIQQLKMDRALLQKFAAEAENYGKVKTLKTKAAELEAQINKYAYDVEIWRGTAEGEADERKLKGDLDEKFEKITMRFQELHSELQERQVELDARDSPRAEMQEELAELKGLLSKLSEQLLTAIRNETLFEANASP